jgi:hypothetical protein
VLHQQCYYLGVLCPNSGAGAAGHCTQAQPSGQALPFLPLQRTGSFSGDGSGTLVLGVFSTTLGSDTEASVIFLDTSSQIPGRLDNGHSEVSVIFLSTSSQIPGRLDTGRSEVSVIFLSTSRLIPGRIDTSHSEVSVIFLSTSSQITGRLDAEFSEVFVIFFRASRRVPGCNSIRAQLLHSKYLQLQGL